MKAIIAIKRPTEAEFLNHIQTGIEKKCIVCNKILMVSWSDYNGQVRCTNCGMTYQVKGSHFKKTWLKKMGIDPKDIAMRYCDCYYAYPVVKYYWKNYKKRIPYGVYLTRHKPWTADEHETFYRFLFDNRRYLMKEFKPEWSWDQIILHYDKGGVPDAEA